MSIKNFPYRQIDLISANEFIKYCRDRGVHISKNLLELFHKKGLLYPCIRLFPKGAFSYGKKGWLEQFIKDGQVTYPVQDKNFIPWKQYEHFSDARGSRWKKYKVLLYSRNQIHLVKEVMDRRTERISFNEVPKEPSVLKKILEKRFYTFDEYFINKEYPDFILFFQTFEQIKNLHDDFENEVVECLLEKEGSIKFPPGTYKYNEILEQEEKRIRKRLMKDFSINAKNFCIDEKWLDHWREKIVDQGLQNHEGLTLAKLIMEKENLSNFYTKGRLRFISDCLEILKVIECFFDLTGYAFLTTEKRYWGNDNNRLCYNCGKTFRIPAQTIHKKTCSEKCSRAAKNKWKKDHR